MKIDSVNILGTRVTLVPIEKSDAKGLAIGIIVEFYLYKGTFQNVEYVFYQSKSGRERTPSEYAWYSDKISSGIGNPAVLITNKRDYNNRLRLFNQGVFFVANEKYVYLPNLVVNTLGHTPKRKRIKLLSPKAQFLLLYWLQNKVLGDDVSISTFVSKWNFSYISVSRALAELEQYGICDSTKGRDNSKSYHFSKDRRVVWEENQKILRNPIKRVVYSNEPLSDVFRIAGVSALSYYSMLNPEDVNSVAVLDTLFRGSSWKSQTNEIEGTYRIEIWCYEPAMFENKKYVDKLSLVLSLREDYDARIEGEVKRVISEMQW